MRLEVIMKGVDNLGIVLNDDEEDWWGLIYVY